MEIVGPQKTRNGLVQAVRKAANRAAFISVVVLTVVFGTLACGRFEPETASNSPAPTTVLSSTESNGEGRIYTPGPALPEPPPGAVTAADAFARVWARPDQTRDTWWADVARWCDQALAQRLSTTDPATIPATRIVDQPRPTGPIRAEATTFTVATDGGMLTLTVIYSASRWLVATIDFTRNLR